MKTEKIYPALLSAFILWILIWVMNLLSGPSGQYFTWDNINPATFLSGMTFFLAFGFGIPVGLSIFLIILLLGLIWWSLYLILKKAFGKRNH